MTLPEGSFSGMNRRDALQHGRANGCTIRPVNGTGEARITHPLLPTPITFNNRQKGTPRRLTSFLRRLHLQRNGGARPS
jgi:hypothetical protein